jgi:hypothetical protein
MEWYGKTFANYFERRYLIALTAKFIPSKSSPCSFFFKRNTEPAGHSAAAFIRTQADTTA